MANSCEDKQSKIKGDHHVLVLLLQDLLRENYEQRELLDILTRGSTDRQMIKTRKQTEGSF